MSQLAFVAAAYLVAICATAALLVQSFVAMRSAEAEAGKLRK